VVIGDRCCGENPLYEAPAMFFLRVEAREGFKVRLLRVRELAVARDH
jgi:hypothetical protein